MRIPSLLALLLLLFGCGKEIGDECINNIDCSPNNDRQCIDQGTNGGYCTIQGCDVDSCPDEAVCVRFFSGGFANKPCDPATEDRGTDDCSFDELCSLAGTCVARSSETRFCMRKCGSGGDCRDGYECRDEALMKAHGGEPVPGSPLQSGKQQAFCAIAPSAR
jgi:hypothetical protein